MEENCLICYNPTGSTKFGDVPRKTKLIDTICSLFNLPDPPYRDILDSSIICHDCVERVGEVERLLKQLQEVQEQLTTQRNDLEKLLVVSHSLAQDMEPPQEVEDGTRKSLNFENRSKIVEKLHNVFKVEPTEKPGSDSMDNKEEDEDEDYQMLNFDVEAILNEDKESSDGEAEKDKASDKGELKKSNVKKKKKDSSDEGEDMESNDKGDDEGTVPDFADDPEWTPSPKAIQEPVLPKSKTSSKRRAKALKTPIPSSTTRNPSQADKLKQKPVIILPKIELDSEGETFDVKDEYISDFMTKNQTNSSGLNLRRKRRSENTLKTHSKSPKTLQKDYKCPDCEFRSSTFRGYKAHCTSIHGEKQIAYNCPICGAILRTKKEQEQHIRKTHPGIKAFICKGCSKPFAFPRYLEDHLKRCEGPKHEDVTPPSPEYTFLPPQSPPIIKSTKDQAPPDKPESYTCPICMTSFSTKRKYEFHIKRSHPGSKAFPCDVCSKPFSLQRYADDHKRIMHAEKRIPIKCKHCSFQSISEASIRKHMRLNHPKERAQYLIRIDRRREAVNKIPCSFEGCEFKGKNEYATSVHFRLLNHTGRRFTCEECGMVLASAGRLEDHRRVHDGLKPYTCEVCGKCFKTEENLKTHQRYHGLGKPLIKCPECGHGAVSNHTLKVHIANVHQDLRNFICEYCSLAFKQKGRLNEHLKTKHLGVKYICTASDCTREFETKEGLKEHMIRHDPRLGQIYPCTDCEKFFLRPSTLLRHVNEIHRGIKKPRPATLKYPCPHCPRRFDRQFMVERHTMAQHGAEKPFPCHVCGKRFPTVYYLKRHKMQVHSSESEKNFTCEICVKKYAVKEALFFHNLHHHPELIENAEELLAKKKDKSIVKKKRKLGGVVPDFGGNSSDSVILPSFDNLSRPTSSGELSYLIPN